MGVIKRIKQRVTNLERATEAKRSLLTSVAFDKEIHREEGDK